MNFKQFRTQVPTEYQELTFIANSGAQYIDTGLKGSDLADCELEIVMRNDTTSLNLYNFNGSYLSGSTAQFGLVATSDSECRSSMNFGFADAVSTTGLNISEFHTLYATNGLQKVDNTVVGTFNFGTMNDGNFLLFARTDPSQTSGINICKAMSLKSFTVKRNNKYIRNMIPAKRKSDNIFGLYDTVNGVFYTNQGAYNFTGGTVVEPTWHDTPHYIHNTSTDTITTLPAVLYPNDTTATVGISGNMEQNGTPTPQNPITPSECGERTGNLFASVWETGGINANTGENTPSTTAVRTQEYIPITPNQIYSFARSITGSYIVLRLYDSNKGYISGSTAETTELIAGYTVTQPMGGNTSFCCFKIIDSRVAYIRIVDNTNNANTKYMMVKGEYTAETMPDYEPYGYKIPISSANTTTPVYLGEVQTTRKIRKVVFDGTENWLESTAQSGRFRLYSSDYLKSNGNITSFCSHYTAVEQKSSGAIPNNSQNFYSGSDSTRYIFIVDERYTTAADFKAYLAQQYAAGTPVCVWYVLATEETGIVNEPLMKIGDYADSISGISIPTTAGANTLDVDTTVKPSEVTANYSGWHPVSAAHERSGGAWT